MLFLRNYKKLVVMLLVVAVIMLPITIHDNIHGTSNSSNGSDIFNITKLTTDTGEPSIVTAKAEMEKDKAQNHLHEVIVKWRDGTVLPEIPGTKVLVKDSDERVAKLAVDKSIAVQDVVTFANRYSELEYIQPNYRYKIQGIPNDPGYQEQWHHERINMPKAWDLYNSNRDIIIAVLDTGVDLNHPELVQNLVTGYNVIDPTKSVQDDYGHGTQVTGILAAVGNNSLQGSGVLWRAKIMPIKVLDGTGEGDDFSIGQGIRYAVKNGAKIIVLSLGDRLYSRHMDEAVQYAEEKGVLLVAATGNNSSTVNYPAAFPTVLAVGASDENDLVLGYSNFGSEIDVVAPAQNIYTTALRGQMTYNSGTSMSAPIVAGIAALIYKKYPDMEPWQVRQLIRQSAVDIGEPGWDQFSGYGRVDAHRALTMKPEVNIRKPNSVYQQAKPFPDGTIIDSSLVGINDAGWYYIDVINRGKLHVQFDSKYRGLQMSWYKQDKDGNSKIYPIIYSQNRTLEPGRYYIRVNAGNINVAIKSLQENKINPSQYNVTELIYRMEYKFQIAEDKWEPNNSIKQAALIDFYQEDLEYMNIGLPYVLINATLHRDGDSDWYKLDLPYSGEVIIDVSNKYGRLDPVLTISKTLTDDYRKYDVIDDHAHGAGEYWRGEVKAGALYFMIADYQLKGHPVPYQVKVTYIPKYEDRWEPNGSRLEAPTIPLDYSVDAFLDGNDDRDWYGFIVSEQTDLQIDITEILPQVMLGEAIIDVKIYESTKESSIYSYVIDHPEQKPFIGRFSPGVYYVMLARSGPENANNRQLPYKLRLSAVKENEGKLTDPLAPQVPVQPNGTEKRYLDITGTDLIEATNYLSDLGIVKGFPDNTFRPKASLTRAETISLLLRAIDITKRQSNNKQNNTNKTEITESVNFEDINEQFWAYNEIKRAVSEGLIVGFGDNTVRPNQAVTRAELVVMLNRIYGDKIADLYSMVSAGTALSDVPSGHWAYNEAIMCSRLGLLKADERQNFFPNRAAEREELVLAIYKLLTDDHK